MVSLSFALFKLTKRIDNNLDNREDYYVDNRDVNDKYDAKTTFFHTNVFHLGIIVVYLHPNTQYYL